MCVTVIKYDNLISLLNNAVYPSINQLFADSITEDKSPESTAVASLYEEFNLLEKFESKLIFPSIVSMLNQSPALGFSPNIKEIILLTKSKEDKITKLLAIVKETIEQAYNDGGSNDINLKPDIEKLIDAINNYYFPLKRKWAAMLGEINPEKVNCKNRISGKCKCVNDILENIKGKAVLS